MPEAGERPPGARRLSFGEASAEPGILAAWRAAAEARSNPFITPEWFRAWLESHPGEEPWLLAWEDGARIGFLPLTGGRSGPLRVLRFAGAERGDWFEPACAPGDEEAMAAACAELLRGERRSGSLVMLDRVAEGAGSRPGWVGRLGAAGARPRHTDVLPFVELGADGYEGYLAGRSRNFRSQLGRRRRKLEREHGLEFRMTSDASELERDMETFFALHEERWEARGGTGALSADAKDHHRRFAAAALERGWLRLWIAEADGAPAAAWYGWRLGERYLYSLSGLASSYKRLALGTVLLAWTIEQAAAEGAAVYDLMWGDDPYKARFETGRREVGSWLAGRRGHPARRLVEGADALIATARRLPPGLKDPARRLLRRSG